MKPFWENTNSAAQVKALTEAIAALHERVAGEKVESDDPLAVLRLIEDMAMRQQGRLLEVLTTVRDSAPHVRADGVCIAGCPACFDPMAALIGRMKILQQQNQSLSKECGELLFALEDLKGKYDQSAPKADNVDGLLRDLQESNLLRDQYREEARTITEMYDEQVKAIRKWFDETGLEWVESGTFGDNVLLAVSKLQSELVATKVNLSHVHQQFTTETLRTNSLALKVRELRQVLTDIKPLADSLVLGKVYPYQDQPGYQCVAGTTWLYDKVYTALERNPESIDIEHQTAADELKNLQEQCDAIESMYRVEQTVTDRLKVENKRLTETVDDLRTETDRLKDIIKAMEYPVEAKCVRFEFLNSDKGCALVVTDPRGDEKKMAEDVAGYINLVSSVAVHLSQAKTIEEMSTWIDRLCRDVLVDYGEVAKLSGADKLSKLHEAFVSMVTFETDIVTAQWVDRLASLEQKFDEATAQLHEMELRHRREMDAVYGERNKLVALLSAIFPASLERHVDDPNDSSVWKDEWRWVVIMDLPSGQASWHIHETELPSFDHLLREQGRVWDKHDTDEKYLRVMQAVFLVLQKDPNDSVDWSKVAEVAYQAYAAVTDNKNFQGEPMPEFGVLPEKIQEAWRGACVGIAEYLRK